MLPRPLYGYQVDRADLTDGALFAFVQGTDPEVLASRKGPSTMRGLMALSSHRFLEGYR